MLSNISKNEFIHAIENNQFHLYYQPVIDLQTGHIVGMEALIRWEHPELGLIPANQFISIAEEFSIINPLGNWIFREVCLNIRNWIKQDIQVPCIAINVSPKQLQDPLFIEDLMKTMSEFDVNPRNITLEITEHLLINHDEDIELVLKKIKAYGFNLSLDDFGTGYSALGYLKRYPFDYVKIDRSFIEDIMEDVNDAAIAYAVISMAHSMGIRVIAEGVENEAQCELLSKNMCDYIQGYLVSKPLPQKEAGEFLLSKYTLPENMRRFMRESRTLLVVDDELNILSSLKRIFRQDGYQVFTANGAIEGLEILKNNSVGVIISDHRMPVMTGAEFLRQAKTLYPDTIRIVLSGYTELQSITDAINEGAIYKFLTKPWNDQQLREHILEAFKQRELIDENRRLGLEIRTANQEFAMVNRQLATILEQKEQQIDIAQASLTITEEVLRHMPIPVLGIDENGIIAFVNLAAEELFTNKLPLLREGIDKLLPNFTTIAARYEEGEEFSLNIPDFDYSVNYRTMSTYSNPGGKLITLFQKT